MEKRLSRRELFKVIGAGALATALPSSEVLEPEMKFFHNGQIGIEMSEFLPGIIDLKYFNKETNRWILYNNIVPEVKANGTLNNVEMFSSKTSLHHATQPDGTQEIGIEYKKMEGMRKIGDYRFEGNGAEFKVIASIPPDSQEITFRVEQSEDSETIQEVSLGNFFGAADRVRYLDINGEIVNFLTQRPDVDDGNFKIGQFHNEVFPDNSQVFFWGDRFDIVQYQKISGNVGNAKFMTEKRETPWRPEQSDPNHIYNPGRPWLEMVRFTQQYNPDSTWTFGYKTQ